jgi:hypothetical protein
MGQNMREIEFRGKRKSEIPEICGEWVYGYYAVTSSKTPAIYNGNKGFNKYGNHWASVTPETVGQYTGLMDKNGVKIFEGDIVRWDEGYTPIVVNWRGIIGEQGIGDPPLFVTADYTVIGNIHDNPELLEAGKQGGTRNEG